MRFAIVAKVEGCVFWWCVFAPVRFPIGAKVEGCVFGGAFWQPVPADSQILFSARLSLPECRTRHTEHYPYQLQLFLNCFSCLSSFFAFSHISVAE